jgi:hypothetical protein
VCEGNYREIVALLEPVAAHVDQPVDVELRAAI